MGQRCALLWPTMLSHRSLSAIRRCCPNGVSSINMADTTNVTYDGGIDVPHCSLSSAKIGINSETSKLFAIIFHLFTYERDVGSNSHVSFVLSSYKNYVLFFYWSFFLMLGSFQPLNLILNLVDAVTPCLMLGV